MGFGLVANQLETYSTYVVGGCQMLSVEIGVYNEAHMRVYILARAREGTGGVTPFLSLESHVCVVLCSVQTITNIFKIALIQPVITTQTLGKIPPTPKISAFR